MRMHGRHQLAVGLEREFGHARRRGHERDLLDPVQGARVKKRNLRRVAGLARFRLRRVGAEHHRFEEELLVGVLHGRGS